jgi:parallel beta-helix repeat protein
MHIFKTITLTLGLFFIINTASARKFFVSSTSGNDNNTFTQAQNQTTPWASINKVNSQMANFAPGDTICFKRGDSFFGQLIISKSGTAAAPIVFADYGSGAMPIITGELALGNWVSAGTNIYKTTATNLVRRPNLLVWNNQVMQIARYPNFNSTDGGYLTIDTCYDEVWLKSSGIPAASNWVGGEAVIRSKDWILDRPIITAQNGNELSVSINGVPSYSGAFQYYDIPRYWGMFLQNAVAALDQQGEYCYLNNTKELFVYSSTNPTSSNIKVPVIDTLIRLQDNTNYVQFKNLNINFANKIGIVAHNSTGFIIDNCFMQYVGISFGSLTLINSTIKDSKFYDSENNGFVYIQGSGLVFRNNELRRMGVRRGGGLSGDAAYVALGMKGNNYLVEYNRVDSTGYGSIEAHFCNNMLMRYNYFTNAVLCKTDGGAISSYYDDGTTGRVYEYNIVDGVIGDVLGTYKSSNRVTGFYPDEWSNRITFRNNTITNSKSIGIYTHISNRHTITNNNIFNCVKGVEQIFEAKDTAQNALSTFKHNTIHNSSPQSISYSFGSKVPINGTKLFTNYDSNYFYNLFDYNKIRIQGWYTMPDGSFSSNAWSLERFQSQFNSQLNTKVLQPSGKWFTVNSYVGTNRIIDSAFNNTNIWANWYVPGGYNRVVLDRSTGGILDAGYMTNNLNALVNDETNKIVVGNYAIGDLQAGKNYVFKFSGKASQRTNGNSFYTFNPSPYTNTAGAYSFEMDTARKEYEFLVQPDISKTTNQLEISALETPATLYFDNMSLREANITYTNPDDYVFFKYNATTAAVTENLPTGFWKDVKGKLFGGNIEVPSFGSVILYKTTITAKNYFVATNGSDNNPGTISQPFATINKFNTVAGPGDTCFVRGGTYNLAAQNTFNKNGTANAWIVIRNYQNEVPVLDLTNTPDWNIALAIKNTSYVKVVGLQFTKAHTEYMAPCYIENSSNIWIENCKAYFNQHTGFDVNATAASGVQSNITFKNCDSYQNDDFVGATPHEDADGFQLTSKKYRNVVYDGCRSWNNADDGFDFYFADSSAATLTNCWSFKNGKDINGNALGNGNGFKLGGNFNDPRIGYVTGGHKLSNCLAWGNTLNGYDFNSGEIGQKIFNSVAYNNGQNFALGGLGAHNVKNSIDYVFALYSSSFGSNSSTTSNSWTLPVTVNNSDFVTLSDAGTTGARQANGDLPVLDFLKLAASSDLIDKGTNVGLAFLGTAPDLGAYETLAATPCNAPTGLSSTSITTNSATVSWAAVSGAVTYTVEYKLASASTWTVLANTASTTQNITGLSASSLYDWRVKTNCTSNQSTYASVQFTTAAPASTCNKNVLFVNVNGVANTGTADKAMVDRMTALGYTVTVKRDYNVTTADTTGKGLIFISPTVVPSYVGTKFRNVSKPVVVCDNKMFVNMSMVGTGASNSSYVILNNINITNATHPIASGVTTGVISTNNNYAYWGNPSTSAAKIANVPGNTNRWMVYSYDAGNAMSGLNAPGRRVGYYLYDNAALYFNANAWKLFDNIVNWTACNNLTGARVATNTIASTPAYETSSEKAITHTTIALYPNPVMDVLTVTGLQQNTQLQVVDINGKVIINTTANIATIQLPVNNLTTGTYLLKVVNGKATQTLKFVKL